jgi:superfamily II DNA or RNA helicase
LSFKDIELKPEYRSKLSNVVKDFYIPVLKEAVLYQRAVGFFSSSSLLAISEGICGLIENDGKMQLIASPRLTEEDIEAINDGLKRRDDVIKDVLLRELRDPIGPYEKARLNLLSNLIASGKLEIRIAFMETDNTIGMFHEKLGLMHDLEGNVIAFSGSMNESENAFVTNYEQFDVFGSWTKDEDRVLIKQSAFNAMWNDYEPGLKVMHFPDISDAIIKKYKVNDTIDTTLDDLPFEEMPSLENNEDLEKDDGIIEEKKVGPKIPSNVHMRQYQLDAIESWKQHQYRGIFDMATGTGKTYTALAAISELYKDMHENLAVIIICPYQHLVEQWKDDIVAFGMRPIICYSASSQKDWRKRLKNAVTGFNIGVQKHFCIVSTNATFSTDYVQNLVYKLSGNVILVVDEAHNFGAKKLSKMLQEHIPYRLALSATIDRHGDPEGTQKLYDYFGDKCIEYTLKDAIDNNMLTPYYYHPVVVSLNEEELAKYLALTGRIRKNIHNDKNGKTVLSDYVKMLLIRRARIVAGAEEKIARLKEKIEDYKDDNHMLVYCGATTMHDVDYQEGKPPIEEARQIDIVADMLGNDLHMRVSKFTSEEDAEERERIKEDFAAGTQLQALVAIRCLDEGVNIPSIKTAFILASSTNPKEYVQRRGRVLRKFPGKEFATIYDFVTLPIPLADVSNYNSDAIESVRSLAKREIDRIKDFAAIAENPFDSDSLIAEIQREYDINSEENEEETEEDYVG